MKSKKLKILAPILSVGALATVLIPTITLTSCSATATPYIANFSSESSNVTYSNSTQESVNFQTKLDANGNMFETKVTIANASTAIDASYFDKEWKNIQKTDKNLPETIYKLNSEITNANTLSSVQAAIKNQNILTLFIAAVNNIKNLYANYDSLFINKNTDIANLSKDQFVKYLVTGLNKDKSYARLWLSDISFDVQVDVTNDKIGFGYDKTETEKPIIAKISNIKLKYEWFWLNDNGSEKIQKLEELQKLATNEKDKPKKLSYTFATNELKADLYFKGIFNSYNNKFHKTGLILPETSMPVAFEFRADQQNSSQTEQNRKKTDFFNTEVFNLIKTKIIDESHFNDLYKKVGYLTKADLPKDNNFKNINLTDADLNKGKEFIKKIFGKQPTASKPNGNN